MPTLPSDLRNKLERVVIEARDMAEVGARAALEALAVHHHEPYPHMKPAQRELRNHLRARARQLGDRVNGDRMRKSSEEAEEAHPVPGSATPRKGAMDITHLVTECAYEHWHRMLFARFLAENNLLIEPEENMAISLTEAEELARDDGVDVWVFASRCAQGMLPQIFRPNDPLFQVSFAIEHLLKLEKLLVSLPAAVFIASDALGWVYQFWQSKKKDEVNRSEVKIGADEIAAVTQLFTEPYMVEFLIHNTLGAWWAGKKLDAKDAANAKTEDELRAKLALPGVTWDYLRFVREENGDWLKRRAQPGDVPVPDFPRWRPAAGTFNGWPKIAKSIKGLDPCCGSGHFPVALFRHLVPIRMAEEDLSAREAIDAVLHDNIHGLEIDERCCQIAAFALALAAWTYPAGGGYRPLPELHIACTGIGPQATEEQWVKLAEQSGMPTQTDDSERVKNGLLNLHRLFSQAPTLGSLINPSGLSADVFTADYETIQPYLAAILQAEMADDETRERAIAAAGMVKAADLLAREYTLVITNVPYLARGAQSPTLSAHCEQHYSISKVDLATVFLERCGELLRIGGSCGLVLPRIWTTYTKYYEGLRRYHLSHFDWQMLAALGPRAFVTIGGEIVDVVLFGFSATAPKAKTVFSKIDCASLPVIAKKIEVLAQGEIAQLGQLEQLKNPGATIVEGTDTEAHLIEDGAAVLEGLSRGDVERYDRRFWELPRMLPGWTTLVAASTSAELFHGRSDIFYWQEGRGDLARSDGARIQGQEAWGKNAVFVARTHLNATVTLGSPHAQNGVAIVPQRPDDLLAILAFCRSEEYRVAVKRLNQKLIKPTGVMGKVPFDRKRWLEVAVQQFGDGIPEAYSHNPTENVFDGSPAASTSPLVVAVVRLLGFDWHRVRPDALASLADDDGIVCIPSVRGEEPVAERLEALLAATGIKPARVCELAGGTDLEDWLRNNFFEEHCKLFHDRPFVWHIWDGRKRDGFHALINCHKLCEGGGKGRRLLESLTYAYLGEWITRQKDGVKRGEEGAEDRLAAALELQKRLEAILAGEPPFDTFCRWKPLHQQPIGWEPDINDGVRLNIRPFLASDLPGGRAGAGILRYKPNIKWTKDRGKEPQRPKEEYPWFWSWDEKVTDFLGGKTFDGNRWNDCHYTNKTKQAAREAAETKERKN